MNNVITINILVEYTIQHYEIIQIQTYLSLALPLTDTHASCFQAKKRRCNAEEKYVTKFMTAFTLRIAH